MEMRRLTYFHEPFSCHLMQDVSCIFEMCSFSVSPDHVNNQNRRSSISVLWIIGRMPKRHSVQPHITRFHTESTLIFLHHGSQIIPSSTLIRLESILSFPDWMRKRRSTTKSTRTVTCDVKAKLIFAVSYRKNQISLEIKKESENEFSSHSEQIHTSRTHFHL